MNHAIKKEPKVSLSFFVESMITRTKKAPTYYIMHENVMYRGETATKFKAYIFIRLSDIYIY